MDLGFGNSNQVVGDATAKALLQSTRVQEAAVQAEMEKYDALLESSQDELEILRERRLAQLKKAQAQKQKWREAGHGLYQDLGQGQDSRDVARDFFEETKQSSRLVVHFYRPTTRICDVVHSHLEKLAPHHLETKFVKLSVENCDTKDGGGASFLVEKLGIVVMPTIVIVKDRKVVHHIRGFDELGGSTNFSTKALAYVLGTHGGLIPKEDEMEMPDELDPDNLAASLNGIRINHKTGRGEGGPTSSSIKRGIHDKEYYDDEEEEY
eukprot:CAMPEP_0195266548 /NCGR_PEP_ID=MMETSP0706-20130129/12074_1 /TAXON_ID=33640 /ORGANISM="Asterionellopsis glacialis, Strain CCMP134" /LENGTH=265 /DNA_ID=CAMNT_0040321157 /DNA_START=35 /DNA_END=832 /DNA_ORIENTATION=-